MQPLQKWIFYGTRQKDNADYVTIEEFALPNDARHNESIEVSCMVNGQIVKQQMRRVAVYSAKYNKAFD